MLHLTSLMTIGKEFLAGYGADQQDNLRTGTRRRDPWRLAGNVYWHSLDGVASESCKCEATGVGHDNQPPQSPEIHQAN